MTLRIRSTKSSMRELATWRVQLIKRHLPAFLSTNGLVSPTSTSALRAVTFECNSYMKIFIKCLTKINNSIRISSFCSLSIKTSCLKQGQMFSVQTQGFHSMTSMAMFACSETKGWELAILVDISFSLSRHCLNFSRPGGYSAQAAISWTVFSLVCSSKS